jgi:SAM-dependent methyltransferase
VPGYGGRLAPNGSSPTCGECASTERHRIVNAMYRALAPLTAKMRCLQFAPDASLEASRFARYDASVYNGANSMDMTRTGLPDASYDLVASNHVLEHVADHHAAIREMIRVVGPSGVVHLCVPSPAFVPATRDWGFADKSKTFHYRAYGADAALIFLQAMPELHVICGVGRDTATDTYELVFWLSRDSARLLEWTTSLQRAQFAVVTIR